MKIGGLEAGGTKMVCAIGDENGNIFKEETFPTKMPEDTICYLYEFFEKENIEALGIGNFGPIDPDPSSETYGYITTTPKKGWQNYDMVGAFKGLNVPIGFDTDVNGSVLGESAYGIGKGYKNLVYITIGTGIGAGILQEGKLVHGMLHPEAGHMLLRRYPNDKFEGNCPFHKDCAEGLCAGPAILKRTGISPKDLKDDDEAWDYEAYYIAQMLVNMTMVSSPEKFILGGGVMHKLSLFPMIRKYYKELMNGYIKTEELDDLDNYIVPQSLSDKQGILGAVRLGYEAYKAAL